MYCTLRLPRGVLDFFFESVHPCVCPGCLVCRGLFFFCLPVDGSSLSQMDRYKQADRHHGYFLSCCMALFVSFYPFVFFCIIQREDTQREREGEGRSIRVLSALPSVYLFLPSRPYSSTSFSHLTLINNKELSLTVGGKKKMRV